MARINNLTNFLTDIATAIKSKTGRNTNIAPSNFDTEILSIASDLTTKTITTNGTYNASSDSVDGYSSVTVNVPSSGTSSITKTPITVNDFTQTMEQKGYTVTDNTSRYSSISWVQTVLNVTDSSWSIDFCVLDTIEHTRSLYNNNVSTMEYLKNDGDVETVETGYICSKHTLTSSSSYTVASTIDNTMVYVSSNISGKSEIDGILNDVGY